MAKPLVGDEGTVPGLANEIREIGEGLELRRIVEEAVDGFVDALTESLEYAIEEIIKRHEKAHKRSTQHQGETT